MALAVMQRLVEQGDKRDQGDRAVVGVIPHYQSSGRCSHNRHQERAGAGLTCRVTFLPYNPSYTILYTYTIHIHHTIHSIYYY